MNRKPSGSVAGKENQVCRFQQRVGCHICYHVPPGHCQNHQRQQDGQGWMQGENLDRGLVRTAQQQDGRRPEENPDSRALHDRDLESGWDEP